MVVEDIVLCLNVCEYFYWRCNDLYNVRDIRYRKLTKIYMSLKVSLDRSSESASRMIAIVPGFFQMAFVAQFSIRSGGR